MKKLSLLVTFAAAVTASAACVQSTLTTGNQTDGANYVLYMPETSCWNGNMVVFAHGYVQPGLPIGVPQDQLTIGGLLFQPPSTSLATALPRPVTTRTG